MTLLALLLASVVAQARRPATDSATLCVADARTRAPLAGAELTMPATASSPGHSRRLTGACVAIGTEHADSLRVSRAGYVSRWIAVSPAAHGVGSGRDTLRVLLPALDATRAERLEVVRVSAARSPDIAGDVRTAGRTTATLSAADARAAGASTVNAVLALAQHMFALIKIPG